MYNGYGQAEQLPGFAPPPSRGWNQGGSGEGPSYSGPAGFAPYARRSQGLGFGPGGPGGPGGPIRVAQYITEGEDDGSQFLASDYGSLPHQFPASTGAGNEQLICFVGNIATNLHDFWVARVLSCAGGMLELERPKDAANKPRAFAFAKYGDFDTVLRCLEVVHGCPLKGEDGKEKALAVKADEKTRKRLDQYARTRARTDADEEHLNYARNNLQHVLGEMREPGANLFQTGGGPIRRRRIVAHLQDLEPEDLPPESRGMITNEIASFRNMAFKKDPAREVLQRAEAEAAAARARERAMGGPPAGPRVSGGFDRPPMNGGYGQRPPPQGPPSGFVREADRYQRGPDPRGGPPQQFSPHHNQPPPQFQQQPQQQQPPPQQQQPVEPPDEGVDDESIELRRVEAKRREAENAFREVRRIFAPSRLTAQRERVWEAHERQREAALRHDADRERREQVELERLAAAQGERYAKWDDDHEAERGRELFYSDRPRWRTSRRAARQRELDADKADAELEAKQTAESSAKSDAFLSSLGVAPNAPSASSSTALSGTGASLDDSTPIKLSLVVPVAAKDPSASTSIQLPKLSRPATAFVGADEDEDGAGIKRKRELIPLTYDDIDPEAGLTEEEKLERRKQMVKDLVNSIPTDKDSLWSFPVNWDYLTDDIIDKKLATFVNKKAHDALGFDEPEIVRAVIEHVRAKKSAAELADELSPVLEDETDEFVIKCWRFVIYECLASQQGILTTV